MQTTRRPVIGYVAKMFPRLSETFILHEILELERQGLSLRIFSMKRSTDPVVQQECRLVQSPITYLPERFSDEPWRALKAQWGVLRRHPRSYSRALLNAWRGQRRAPAGKTMARFCQACCLIHEGNKIEHLHAHFASNPTRLAYVVHRISELPYSISTHAKDVFLDGRLTDPGFGQKVGQARFVIANSRYSAACLRAALDGEARAQICTVYNGVDLGSFPQRQAEPVEPLILSVGRLVEKKGFPALIQACGRLKERSVPFRCLIVGAGNDESALRRLIRDRELTGHVELIGPLSQTELRRYYQQAMVFALPCVVAKDGDRDLLPNVLKEAMAVGVPVVTTSIPAMEELIEHEVSGLLVPPADAEALSGALERLLADASLRHRLTNQARKVIEERFDKRVTVAQIKQLLIGALAEQSRETTQSEVLERSSDGQHGVQVS